jgi:hypothetical protein
MNHGHVSANEGRHNRLVFDDFKMNKLGEKMMLAGAAMSALVPNGPCID